MCTGHPPHPYKQWGMYPPPPPPGNFTPVIKTRDVWKRLRHDLNRFDILVWYRVNKLCLRQHASLSKRLRITPWQASITRII